MKRRVLALIALNLTVGCALKVRTPEPSDLGQSSWHGRLALQVEEDPVDPMSRAQSFSAAFELSGSPNVGELRFFTPVGNTAAAIHWNTDLARLEFQGEVRSYAGLPPLIRDLLGAEVPVSALFAWLAGRNESADGWHADLSHFADGKILAQRLAPKPRAQLRLVLEP